VTSGIWWDLAGFIGNIKGLNDFGAEVLSHHCLIQSGPCSNKTCDKTQENPGKKSKVN